MMNEKQVILRSNIKKFFNYWLILTKPFHKLRPREREVLALFLYYSIEYRTKISDERLVWKMVFDYDTKLKIREELNIEDTNLQNLMTALRKNGAIIKKDYERINPSYIPKILKNSKRFDLTFTILIDEEIKEGN